MPNTEPKKYIFEGSEYKEVDNLDLTNSDKEFIEFYKGLEYGELTVFIRNSVPVKVHQVIKAIKLDGNSKR